MDLIIKQDNLEITVTNVTTEECVQILKNGVENVLVKSSETPRKATTHNTYSARNNNNRPVANKNKLVFFKCTKCGSTFCRMIDVDNIPKYVECKCGTRIFFEYDDLYRGKYKCDCGTTGSFLMQDTVSEVKCRKCYKRISMLKEGKEYVGYTF